MAGDITKYSELKQYRLDDSIVPPYMRAETATAPRWTPFPTDLFNSPQFNKLNPRTALALIKLYVRQADGQQQNCLYNALSEYNELYSLGMTDEDISRESYYATIKNAKSCAGLFTATDKQMLNYGFCDRSAVSHCIKELVQAGFIEVVWNEKGRYSAWSKNQTVYAFSDKWHDDKEPKSKRQYKKKPGPKPKPKK